MTRPIQPQSYCFADDGQFPNSYLPVLLYRAQTPTGESRLDDWFEERLVANNWLGIWRNGILPYPHYHSTSHEVLCIYAGWVAVLLGGPGGSVLTLQAGDVVVLPAGVAHQNQRASADLAVLGGYPEGRSWDLLTGKVGERPAADHRINELPLPANDPLFGPDGPLVTLWRTAVDLSKTGLV